MGSPLSSRRTVLTPPSIDPGSADASAWPEPSIDLDNRDLDPPEPMARILEATERMKAGEVLSALLLREPRFLFPELAKRGHQWRGGFDPERTTYRISIRVGSASGGQGMTAQLVARIRDALRNVIDPELGYNVVDLGFIYDIAVEEGGVVRITMTTTTPGCPAAGYLREGVANSAWGVPDVEFVDVQVTSNPRGGPT